MPSKQCNAIIKQALQSWTTDTPVLKAIKAACGCGDILPAALPIKKKKTTILIAKKPKRKVDKEESEGGDDKE